ncbi:MAG: hypothetical protein SVU69_01235 [Pseudomonadota bacterium]|nr:hypothetical protein [Pseudomonadota bacterium]
MTTRAVTTDSDIAMGEYLREVLSTSEDLQTNESLYQPSVLESEIPEAADCSQIVSESRYLVFVVADINLAVPADAVDRVGSPPNVGSDADSTVAAELAGKLVDTAKTILPEGRYAHHPGLPTHAVYLKSGLILLCDRSSGYRTVNVDAVCWRGEHGRRAWLAGTLPSERLAILDVAALEECAVADSARSSV